MIHVELFKEQGGFRYCFRTTTLATSNDNNADLCFDADDEAHAMGTITNWVAEQLKLAYQDVSKKIAEIIRAFQNSGVASGILQFSNA
jgi:hypothetical protein